MRRAIRGSVTLTALLGGAALVGCGSDGGGDSGGTPERSLTPGEVVARAFGDETELEVVYEPSSPKSATDLAFNPRFRGELWVVLRELDFVGAPCNQPTETTPADIEACEALIGRVAIVEGAHRDEPNVTEMEDANGWHFMRRPTGIAFGGPVTKGGYEGDSFATCGEHRTGNFDDDPSDYMGPTLWSSDPAIFGPDGPGGNGSHLDMLHATPFCMGIAHEAHNVYWLWNGNDGALDRYDFREPHVPGGADHSDGSATRYLLGELARVEGVPSGLAFDAQRALLYVADTGNARVLAVDVESGTEGPDLPCADEQLDFRVAQVVNSDVTDIVPVGVLDAPAGLEFHGDVLFVSDNATSRIHAFTAEGDELASVDTGLPTGSIGGIAIGPDGLLYLADLATGAVRRLRARR